MAGDILKKTGESTIALIGAYSGLFGTCFRSILQLDSGAFGTCSGDPLKNCRLFSGRGAGLGRITQLDRHGVRYGADADFF